MNEDEPPTDEEASIRERWGSKASASQIVGDVMWIALLSAIALPVVVGVLLLKVKLHGGNAPDSNLPYMHL